LGTTLWLVWVMGGLVGVDGMGRMFVFLLGVAIACWIFGLSQQARTSRRRWLGLALALVLLVGVGVTALRFPAPSVETSADLAARGSVDAKGRIRWSEAAVQQALGEGRPAFVDLTADWCLTCKFNERTVLASAAVHDLFEAHAVAFIVGVFNKREHPCTPPLAAR